MAVYRSFSTLRSWHFRGILTRYFVERPCGSIYLRFFSGWVGVCAFGGRNKAAVLWYFSPRLTSRMGSIYLIGAANLDHQINVLSSKFPHYKITNFPFWWIRLLWEDSLRLWSIYRRCLLATLIYTSAHLKMIFHFHYSSHF